MTDAGKRFAVIGNAYLRESFRQQGYNVDALVAAIEAEAVVAERQRIQDALRTDVEQMVDEHGDRYLHEGDVRRAIDGEVHRA